MATPRWAASPAAVNRASRRKNARPSRASTSRSEGFAGGFPGRSRTARRARTAGRTGSPCAIAWRRSSHSLIRASASAGVQVTMPLPRPPRCLQVQRGRGSNPAAWRSLRVFSAFGVLNAPTSDFTRPARRLYVGRDIGSLGPGALRSTHASVKSWTTACHAATVRTTIARLTDVSSSRRPALVPPEPRCTRIRLSQCRVDRAKLAAASSKSMRDQSAHGAVHFGHDRDSSPSGSQVRGH